MSTVLYQVVRFASLLALIVLCPQHHYPRMLENGEIVGMDADDRAFADDYYDSGHSDRWRSLESSKKIKFAHPTLKLRHNLGNTDGTRPKQHGLFAKEAVTFGTVLAIEYPMITLSKKCAVAEFKHFDQCVRRMVHRQRGRDPEFTRFWDGLEVMVNNPKHSDGHKVCETGSFWSILNPHCDDADGFVRLRITDWEETECCLSHSVQSQFRIATECDGGLWRRG